MLGREKAEDICKEVLRRAGKDAAEVILSFEDQSLTRFANNYIHQNVAQRNVTLMVRLLRGKRMGLATTNRLDGHGLDILVERARANAKISPEDPDYPGLPELAQYVAVDAFDQAT
ncbi:MAG: TldD/PmbA family protein, partial [Deltaproteobacteria bacterium]|nr:TldD/PmbA family protein [Deltaproteobacteria bacterium]